MKKIIKILLCFFVLIISIFLIIGKISHKPFNSEEWKTFQKYDSAEANWTLRWDMMNSLRNNYKLKGMSKQEIIDLLGIDNNDVEDNEFHYYLGYSKHGINTGSLIIIFDKNNKVARFYVWQG